MSGPISHRKLTILWLCLAADRQKRKVPTPPWPCVLGFTDLGLFLFRVHLLSSGEEPDLFPKWSRAGLPSTYVTLSGSFSEARCFDKKRKQGRAWSSHTLPVLPSFGHSPQARQSGPLGTSSLCRWRLVSPDAQLHGAAVL